MVVREAPDRPSKLEVLIEETYKAMIGGGNDNRTVTASTVASLPTSSSVDGQGQPRQNEEEGGGNASSSSIMSSPVRLPCGRLLSSEKKHSVFIEAFSHKLGVLCEMMKERRMLRSISS